MSKTVNTPVRNIFGGYKEMVTSNGKKYRWCYILKLETSRGRSTRKISEGKGWVKVG